MSDDLLIKINADVSDIQKKFEQVKDQTEHLNEALKQAAEVSAIAFAALSAEIGFSTKAYVAHEEASNRLSAALQNQGIYSKQLQADYEEQAASIQDLTGIDNEQIKNAQIALQAQIGRIKITKDLTKAVADFATLERMDVASAAELVGKTIGSSTNALARYGIQVDANAPKSEKLAAVLAKLQAIAGGQSDALGKGVGIFRILGATIDDVQKKLGEQFAPTLELVAQKLNELFQWFEKNDELVRFAASMLAAGAAVTGLVAAATTASGAILLIRAALLALNAQLTITEALLATLGIGLVIAALAELFMHFNQVKAAVSALIGDFRQLASMAEGVGSILKGVATLDFSKIKEGVKQVTDSFSKMGQDVAKAWTEANNATKEGVQVQNEAMKEAAEKRQATEDKADSESRALLKAKNDYLLAEMHNESDALLALKKEEIQELEALQKSHNDTEKAVLRERLTQTREDIKTQRDADLQSQKEYDKEEQSAAKKHGVGMETIKTQADKKELKDIQKNTETRDKARKKVFEEDFKFEQAQHNRFLEEQVKYGTAYAAIDEAMHSAIYTGSKQAFGNLAELQQSSNSTLKGIGQVAAVANVVIKTAESAMNIYEGFSTIPIIGPALGIAGAAAAVAFGAEQIGKINAAQTGALVGGSGFGDKVPYMLEPGELVAPRKSFDEVVSGVAQQRGYKTGEQGGGYAEVRLSLDDNLMDFIEAKLVQRKFLNISLQGSR